MKQEKDILFVPTDFEEYLTKSVVSENSKVYSSDRYCYISKSR